MSQLYGEEFYAKQYKLTGNLADKDRAVMEMEGLIRNAIRNMNVGQNIDNRVMINKARAIALKSIDSWDPKMGVKLSTWVINNMKQLNRTLYKHGPILHIPENRIKYYSTLEKSMEDYEQEYGNTSYDPLILADMSGVPVNEVKNLLQERRKVYNTSSVDTTDVGYEAKDYKFQLDMLDTEFKSEKVKRKVWLEIKKDLDHDVKPSASEIARRLNMNYIDVNNIYKEIIEEINKILLQR